MNKYKAVLFQRVSTSHQDTLRQNRELFAQAEKDGYKVKDIYVIDYKESGVNLSYQQRQGFMELEQVIDNNPIEIVYVHEISRVARRQDVAFTLIQKLTDRKINLHIQTPQILRTLNEDGSANAIANLVISFLSYFAAEEARQFKIRSKGGVEVARSRGQVVSGKVQYGYMIDKTKHPVIDPVTSEFVKRIFDDYVNTDMSTREIWEKYNDLGAFKDNKTTISTHGAAFISRMLKSYTYCGEHKTVNYPAIVSKETIDKAVAKLDDKMSNWKRRKSSLIYYCRGILVTNQNETNGKEYQLTPSKSGGSYDFKTGTVYGLPIYSVSNNVLDTIAKNEALKIYSVYSSSKASNNREWALGRIAQLESDREGLNGQIERAKKEFEKTLDLYKRNFVTMDDVETTKKMTDKQQELLKNKVDAIDAELATLKATVGNEATFEDNVEGVFLHSDEQSTYEIVQSMIKKIVVSRNGKGDYFIDILPKVTAELKQENVQVTSDDRPTRYHYQSIGRRMSIMKVSKDGSERPIDFEIEYHLPKAHQKK